MEEMKEIEIKEFSELCKGRFCNKVDFDAEKPYIVLGNNDMTEEIRVLIPETMAYYLRTHWCGSQKMHDGIENNTRIDVRNAVKKALGIE